MDKIDKFLIEHLQADGRQTTSELAHQVEMSVPAVAERIKKLQENGVIIGYGAMIDPKKVGMDVGAHITLISESSSHYQEVVDLAIAHPEVLECVTLTGEGSHILIVRTENTGTLEKLLSEIQSWPGVKRTEARIVLSQYKERGVIQVADAVIKHQ